MPMYEFACDDCGQAFETLVRRDADISAVTCPSCQGSHVTRAMSLPSANVISGSAMPMTCGAGSPCGRPRCQRTG